ncbi:MAG: type I methionyl aminopeptidase [Dehalococcoidia bacterium]|nr:type I methionyl aminopeptidase [Dehalococcoidia bacterium]
MILVKSPEEIEIMREGGAILAEMLETVKKEVRAGVTTGELDDLVDVEMRRCGVVASFKGYQGYPASACISINDEVVHGIPGARVIREGDIVSVDLGVFCKGFHTDAAFTVGVGKVTPRAAQLMDVTREALREGVKYARVGNHVGDVSAAIQRYVESAGLSVVREYTGHGVGRNLHEDPQIPNFVYGGKGAVLRPGMTLAIEPMVTAGGWRTRVTDNGWTVVTLDGSLSAHFENSVAVTDGEPIVFA